MPTPLWVRGSIAPALCLLLAARADAAVIHVDADATGAATGQTWADAFTSLQGAFAAAAPGDEIWIAEGIYTPPTSASTFNLVSGAGIYGGFVGTETAREQRDWQTHPTILSADIAQDDTFTGWQGTARWYNGWNWNSTNASRILSATACNTDTILDGFTIRNANGADGAGLRIEGGAPTIRNCTFTHNLAWGTGGGAVFCHDSAATFDNCTFIENAAGQDRGGAIAILGPAMPSITRCDFIRGMAWGYTHWQGNGGGIEAQPGNATSAPTLIITDCNFIGNETHNFFQIVQEVRGGAGIWAYGVNLAIDRCIFIANASNEGGAITSWASVNVSNSVFIANDATQYPVSAEISHGGQGAGVCLLNWQTTLTSTITNCTFARNTADEGAAASSYGQPYNLRNSIVWANIARGQDIEPLKRQIRGPVDFYHSCVQDLFTLVPGEDPPDPANFPGCIDLNPLFANAVGSTADDFRLQPTSPCIDAGLNFHAAGMNFDASGAPRIAPVGGIVDQGAFEYAAVPPPCHGDANGDRAVNFADVTSVLANFNANYAPATGPGDANADGYVNFSDITSALANFGSACP